MIKINEHKDFEWFIDMLDRDKSYYRYDMTRDSKQFDKSYYLSINKKYDVKVTVIYTFRKPQAFNCILSVRDSSSMGYVPEFLDKLMELKELISKGFIKRVKGRMWVDEQDLLSESPARFFYSIFLKRDDDKNIEFIHNLMEKELPKFLRAVELQLRRRKGRV